MTPTINKAVLKTAAAPIDEATGWARNYSEEIAGPLLDLAQAVPNYPPAPEMLHSLSEFAAQKETAFYTPILGLKSLRSAYARSVSSHYQTSIDPEGVVISAGGNHAFCMATLALAGSGDEVILGQPHYFNHEMWFTMQGIRSVPLPCHPTASGMLPDPHEAEKLIGPKTRALVLVSPNNPTGTVYPPALLTRFLHLCRDHGIALILDETYKDFLPAGTPPHDLFNERDCNENFVHLFSFSKSYSLTGYRVGALIAGPTVKESVTKIADTITICPPHIGQRAALYGLTTLDAWRDEQTARMSSLANELDRAFKRHQPAFEIVSRGAFFAYLKHPYRGQKSADVCKTLVEQAGLLMLPGSYFGQGQEQYLRLAFANVDEAGLDETARRLAEIELSLGSE